jgi:hypothetical protein
MAPALDRYARADYSTPVKIAPMPRQASEPVASERRYVRAEIRPSGENDPGAIVEGRYAASSDGLVRVWDNAGVLLGSAACKPGDNPEHVARKLLREKRNTGFYDPLPYSRDHIV